MGTGLIFAGFLFLLNPDLFTFDFLPDLIGYLLISLGMKKTAFLDNYISTSRRFVHYLVAVSAVKILSAPAAFTTTVENTRLTICFCFFVVELFLSFIAASNAFRGVQYLLMRKEGDLALKGFETCRFFVMGFVFVKHIGNFLHPATAIFFPNVDADPSVVESVRRPFMTARTVLFAVGAVVVLSFGIYTARVLLAYLRRLREDTAFSENMLRDYREKVTENESMQKRLSIKSGFFYFFVAILFLADLYLDDIGMIPTFFYPLFVFLGLLKLKKVIPLPGWFAWSALGSTVLCFGTYLHRILRLFLIENPLDFGVSFVSDPLPTVLGLLSGASVLVCTACMLLTVKRCAETFTEYGYTKYLITLAIAAVILCDLGFAQYRYPSTFSFLPSVQWVVWVIAVYLHKKSMDDIYAEAEFHLM